MTGLRLEERIIKKYRSVSTCCETAACLVKIIDLHDNGSWTQLWLHCSPQRMAWFDLGSKIEAVLAQYADEFPAHLSMALTINPGWSPVSVTTRVPFVHNRY